MFNPEDVAMSNSKVKLTEVVETRVVRSRADGSRVIVDDRVFDPKLHVEEAEYEAEKAVPANAL